MPLQIMLLPIITYTNKWKSDWQNVHDSLESGYTTRNMRNDSARVIWVSSLSLQVLRVIAILY